MPNFDCDSDTQAHEILRRIFPGREVIGVPAIDLVWGLGTIHCLTQQHPRP
jgi:agmatine deiminase